MENSGLKPTATTIDCMRKMHDVSLLIDSKKGTCCPPGLENKACDKLKLQTKSSAATKGALGDITGILNVQPTVTWRPCSVLCAQAWVPWWHECREIMAKAGLLGHTRTALLQIRDETEAFETTCSRQLSTGKDGSVVPARPPNSGNDESDGDGH